MAKSVLKQKFKSLKGRTVSKLLGTGKGDHVSNGDLGSGVSQARKVAVGLSGGVDSSVAALLLKEQGYDVTAVHIQCWDEKADGCRADVDRTFAVSVASILGVKFEHLDFRKEYMDKVIDYFYQEYQAGRTPNPDVMCNKEIKFGMFFDWAMEKGFDFVATGHYARAGCTEDIDGEKSLALLKGIDGSKDQSYFLYLLDQDHLAKILFPLGEMDKSKVRRIAEKAGLSTADRPDSMGICFIGKVDIKDFLKKRIEPEVGDVKNVEGEIIGEHEGAWFYTIGQRHGFKVSKYQGVPLYVVDKDVDENILIVGTEEDAKRDEFEVSNVHWISGDPFLPGPDGSGSVDTIGCDVRIRHLGELYPAEVVMKGKDSLNVKLDSPVFGVAPGQSAVFYDGDVVMGGGIIC